MTAKIIRARERRIVLLEDVPDNAYVVTVENNALLQKMPTLNPKRASVYDVEAQKIVLYGIETPCIEVKVDAVYTVSDKV